MKLLFSLLFLIFVLKPNIIFAAKKFIPKKNTVTKNLVTSSGVPSIVKLRPDKHGLLLSFSNFNKLEKVNYTFTYSSNGIPQGVSGTIWGNNDPLKVRELLFGTCSSGVCNYHTNLKDAKLQLNALYQNGKKFIKSYKIKTYY